MPSRIQKLLGAALLVLGIAPAATAQTGGVLSGVVRDRAGNPVPGVVLTIVEDGKVATRTVVTDQRGVYFVDRLDYGAPYLLDVSHPRFRKSHVQASANEGETPVHITLAPQPRLLTRIVLFPVRLIRLGL